MIRTIATASACLFCIIPARGGDDQPQYDAARILPGLRVDAPAVIREDLTTFEVVSRTRLVENHTEAYTIFRNEGRTFGRIELGYDRFSQIKDLGGALYDEHGKEIRTLAGDDVKDESDIDASSLYEDARTKTAEMVHDTYPYTVVYSYRIVHDGYLNIPTWVAQGSRDPVEHSRCEAILPAAMELRYWKNAIAREPVVTTADGHRHYVWEASALRELNEDERDEEREFRTAVVRFAPDEFELADRPGTMKDWKSFGIWSAGLYAGKTQLPSEAAREIDSVVAGTVSPVEKARRLYRFLQEKTRYMNVTLGIGGWEPYDASYVFAKGYGDCKALANYMVAILARAGIRSLPALVDAGGNRSLTIAEFPDNRFNHVIVCIPLEKDSVWLECTSKTGPFGELGDFTEARPALLVSPEGGVLVQTPTTGPEDNCVKRIGRVTLTASGDARGDFSIDRKGSMAGSMRDVLTNGDVRKQEQWLLRDLDVNGTSLLSHTVTGVAEHAGQVGLSMCVNMPRFAASSGSRLFFMPVLNHRGNVPPREHKSRKSPVRYGTAFTSVDSTKFTLPAGYRWEAVPSPVHFSASFGEFRSSASASGDTALVHVRYFAIRSKDIPADHYNEYRKFITDVVKADKMQAVAVLKQ